jgi:hypothetical protein
LDVFTDAGVDNAKPVVSGPNHRFGHIAGRTGSCRVAGLAMPHIFYFWRTLPGLWIKQSNGTIYSGQMADSH